MKQLFLCLMLCVTFFTHADLEQQVKEYFFSPDVTSLPVSDWENPTPKDYLLIQNFLDTKVRSIVNIPFDKRIFHSDLLNEEFHGWVTYRMNRGRLAKDTVTESKFCVDYLNNDPDNKDKCVICYSSFASGSPVRDYPGAIKYLLKSLQKFGFDGHFIYQIGGFPNVKNGRLKFADVPFSFKPFLFEQVRDMGYKKILWLDACCIPVKSLDPIFDWIEDKGLCFYTYGSTYTPREFNEGYPYIAPFIDVDTLVKSEQLSSQIVGINVEDKEANHLLDEWIQAAERKIPFLLSDEPPFSILVNLLGLLRGGLPAKYYIETSCNTGNFRYWEKNPDAILYHQYDFLNPEYCPPDDMLNH